MDFKIISKWSMISFQKRAYKYDERYKVFMNRNFRRQS